MECLLEIENPRPYFAELPYFLWGEVNYDSDGDCSCPTARDWTCLQLTHRGTDEIVEITSTESSWKVDAYAPTAVKVAMFLRDRCSAKPLSPLVDPHTEDWNYPRAWKRAQRVAEEFSSPKLRPFDSHLFWGSWKWIGGFATDFTLAGRLIMHSVLKSDPRGAHVCIAWLKNGTFNDDQSAALRHALFMLTGISHGTDRDWIKWYDGSLFRKGAKTKLPDIGAWNDELQKEYADLREN